MNKYVFIETIGCAMNVRDTELMFAELKEKRGYLKTTDVKKADIIIINTCSVRDKPERKLFSEIGVYAKIKKDGAKIGVSGCSASHMGEEIIKRSKDVSFVLGARNISRISEIIDIDKGVFVDINYDNSNYIFAAQNPTASSDKFKALINISIGCNHKCTYCIVPYTRGKEISIPSEIIINEARKRAKEGAKEIILLGQNVNNYGKRFSSDNLKINFTELLKRVSDIEEVKRIRFTSPHPLHMDDEFIQECASNEKIANNIHMPLQSGSTKILKSMGRGYTKEWFLDRAYKIREELKYATISTDIIIGFPGENEDKFEETVDVVKKVQFEQMYSFIYSKRPNTKAITFEGEVELKTSKYRLEKLKSIHKDIVNLKAKEEIGKVYEVYFEEYKNNKLNGRSGNNRFVNVVSDNKNLVGEIKKVKIINNNGVNLQGELI